MSASATEYGSQRTGMAVTRFFERIGRTMSFGDIRTEQEIEEELREILLRVNELCSTVLNEQEDITFPALNTTGWKLISDRITIITSQDENDLLLQSIGEGISLLKARGSELRDYSMALNASFDRFQGVVTQVNEVYADSQIKKERIRQIKEDRSMLLSATLAVGRAPIVCSVVLDSVVLDPLFGARCNTTLPYFFAGYDDLGNPPVKFRDVEKWIESARELSVDLKERKTRLEEDIAWTDRTINMLSRYQIKLASSCSKVVQRDLFEQALSDCNLVVGRLLGPDFSK